MFYILMKSRGDSGGDSGAGPSSALGAGKMGPAHDVATHSWYLAEPPYFSRCFFSSPPAASPARTKRMPAHPRDEARSQGAAWRRKAPRPARSPQALNATARTAAA